MTAAREQPPIDTARRTENARPTRGPIWIRWTAYGAIAINLVLLLRMLPIDLWTSQLASTLEGLGMWAPVVFGVIYVVAALLFVPGAAITIAAGALFGLVGGTVLVSIASTVAAALGFLIGRHFARDAIVRRAATSPRFAAMERAIQQGGWKIVGLLRLSPALPFSLGNYLYGLTPIRFVPYVITSWLAMLPGTVMYVYLGHAGRQSLATSSERGWGQWALLIVGLIATIAVTAYVTYLARRALAEQALNETPRESKEEAPSPNNQATERASSWSRTLLPVCIALLLTCVTTWACLR